MWRRWRSHFSQHVADGEVSRSDQPRESPGNSGCNQQPMSKFARIDGPILGFEWATSRVLRIVGNRRAGFRVAPVCVGLLISWGMRAVNRVISERELSERKEKLMDELTTLLSDLVSQLMRAFDHPQDFIGEDQHLAPLNNCYRRLFERRHRESGERGIPESHAGGAAW
jgi:hypothetical protein